jgi:cytochrome c biogenesis protein CcdA
MIFNLNLIIGLLCIYVFHHSLSAEKDETFKRVMGWFNLIMGVINLYLWIDHVF